MAPRPAEFELTALERTSFGGWEFSVKPPSDRLESLLRQLGRVEPYAIRFITYFPGSGKQHFGKGYEVSEEGMWLLSHLFVNWTEMYEQATGREKRDWRQRYQTCCQCGKQLGSGLNYAIDCKDCRKTFCMGCITDHKHSAQEQAEQRERETSSNTRSQAEFHEFHARFRRLFGEGFVNFDFGPFYATGSSSNTFWQTRTQVYPKTVQEAFKLLGIEPTTDVEAIKRAYKQQALAKHPDRGGSHQEMVALNKAKEEALDWAGEK